MHEHVLLEQKDINAVHEKCMYHTFCVRFSAWQQVPTPTNLYFVWLQTKKAESIKTHIKNARKTQVNAEKGVNLALYQMFLSSFLILPIVQSGLFN